MEAEGHWGGGMGSEKETGARRHITDVRGADANADADADADAVVFMSGSGSVVVRVNSDEIPTFVG